MASARILSFGPSSPIGTNRPQALRSSLATTRHGEALDCISRISLSVPIFAGAESARNANQQDLEHKRKQGGFSAFAPEPASRFYEAVFKHSLFSVERFDYLDTGYRSFAPTNR